MSILIKGVEMPKGCYRGCPCYSFHYCNVLRRDTSAMLGTGKKLDDCPLVPVPPHGRLIDADAVTDAAMEDILGWEDAGCDRSDYRAFLDNYIEDAPTIIPAEEGER